MTSLVFCLVFFGCGASQTIIAQMEAACQAADDADNRLSNLEKQYQQLQTEKAVKEEKVKQLEDKITELEKTNPYNRPPISPRPPKPVY